MIHYKIGDLLEAPENIIAHGVNCVGGFGSGVAGQIAKKWPEVKASYLRDHKSLNGWNLGDISYVLIDFTTFKKYVVNCATQKEYLPRGICHANYDAIKKCMTSLKEFAKKENLTIAIPKIGAGLAGGDWSIIEPIIDDIFWDYNITIYELAK